MNSYLYFNPKQCKRVPPTSRINLTTDLYVFLVLPLLFAHVSLVRVIVRLRVRVRERERGSWSMCAYACAVCMHVSERESG